MADVFISYSSKDSASAEYLLNILESMYISCWMAPRDITKGDNYADLIPSAIRNASIFLILVSQNSQESVQVQNELNFATHTGLPIVAVLLDDSPLSNAFQYHISRKNRFEGKDRLTAVSSELVDWIHTELMKLSNEKQKRQEETDIRTVAPMVWLLLVAGCAAVFICICCVCLNLQTITLDHFLRSISTILILALLAAALIRTPLFYENSTFFHTFLRLLEKLRNKK